MKTIPALIEAVPTTHLRLAEDADELRLRGPVLSLQSDGAPLMYASGWGSPKRRQEAEQALMLAKLLMERAGAGDEAMNAEPPVGDGVGFEEMRVERDAFKAEAEKAAGLLQDLRKKLKAETETADKASAALDAILSDDVTNVKRAKEIAAGVRG